jgi:hypothetical protein
MSRLLLPFIFLASAASNGWAIDYTSAPSDEVDAIMESQTANEHAIQILSERIADLNTLKQSIEGLRTSLKEVTGMNDAENKVEVGFSAMSMGGHLWAMINLISGDASAAFHFRYFSNFLALAAASISTINAEKHDPNPTLDKIDELLRALDELKKQTSDQQLKLTYIQLAQGLLEFKSNILPAQANVQANKAYTFIWASNALTLGKSNFLFSVVSLSAFMYTWQNLSVSLNRPEKVVLYNQLERLLRQIDYSVEALNRNRERIN